MKRFKAKIGIHIPSRKDDIAKLKTVDYLTPEYVYIPLSVKGNDFDIYVNPGDKVKLGQKIAERKKDKGLPIVKHATVSGEVVGQERVLHSSGVPYVCIKIKNDFQDTFIDLNPVEDFESCENEKLVSLIHEAGIIGLGGAGFPTELKYQNIKNIDTVILNGAECEPYITSDYRIMIEDTESVFNGLRILMKIANAEKGIIVIKKGKEEIYELLVSHAKKHENIKVFQVPDEYPAGWEKQVVYRTLKRTYENLPLECGVIVNNVSTACAVAHAIMEGKPLLERIVTVAGEAIVRPRNYRVRIGTLAKELIEQSDGYAPELEEVRVIAGGPMMGMTQKSDDFVISETNSAIIVLNGIREYQVPHNKPIGEVILDVLHLSEHDNRFFIHDEQPCVRCGTCVFHCPAGLQPTLLRQASLAKNEVLLGKLDVTKCIDCGTCAYVCPSHIKINEAIKKGKAYYNIKNKNKK
ncbi:MAG TPA: RnfABCDGE type electron transport complex subunit C [Haloplasmataceae bacterium]